MKRFLNINFKLAFNQIKKSLISKQIAIPLFLTMAYSFHQFYNKKISFCNPEYLKVLLEGAENLNHGEMKEIKFGNKTSKESFLILNYQGEIHALSNFCPHFGAPLHTGLLIDNVLKCPWHGASFDIQSGMCEISPSIDGLNKFSVIKEENNLYALIDLNLISKGKCPEMSKRDPNNKISFVIVGGGPAGYSCAEALRQSGFTVKIKINKKY